MVVSIREFVFVVVGSVALSLVVLVALSPQSRNARRLIAIAVSTTIGVLLWNIALDVTNASALNVDSPLLGLSAQDVGSGVAAFVLSLVVLRLSIDRAEPFSRSLSAATVVGIVTIVVDLLG